MFYYLAAESTGMAASSRDQARKDQLSASVRALRVAKGVSQSVVATAIGVDIKTIQRIEGAKMLPNLAMVLDLADFFDVPPQQIIGPRGTVSPLVTADRLEQGERERLWGAIRELRGAVQELLTLQQLTPLHDQGEPDTAAKPALGADDA